MYFVDFFFGKVGQFAGKNIHFNSIIAIIKIHHQHHHHQHYLSNLHAFEFGNVRMIRPSGWRCSLFTHFILAERKKEPNSQQFCSLKYHQESLTSYIHGMCTLSHTTKINILTIVRALLTWGSPLWRHYQNKKIN